jgi:hypothetical protein
MYILEVLHGVLYPRRTIIDAKRKKKKKKERLMKVGRSLV